MISPDVPAQDRETIRSRHRPGPTPPLESRDRRPVPATSAVSVAAGGLIFAGAVAAVFLAGGPQQGALGIFLVCAGLALVACPPQVKVDGRLWLALGVLVLCGALAFLPEGWFPVPHWRRALEALPVVPLGRSVTPVPWQTGFWLAILGLSGLTGFFLLAHPVRSKWLERYALAAVVVCGGYAALAMYARQTGWHYPFDGGATFGFFPNRNHTATFLVTGSVLAMGLVTVALRERSWVVGALAAAGMTFCVVALCFFSASRGGIVFLLAGTLLWLAGLGRAHLHSRLLISVALLSLAGGALFLVSGSEVRERLLGSAGTKTSVKTHPPATAAAPAKSPSGDAEDTPFEFRLLIYQDAADLVGDFPVTGTGLGAFAADFAQYRQASLSESTALHPESDWLMLTAEAGIPALLCTGALCWLLARRLRGAGDHPYWPLRWGCVAAATAAVLHGFVDVPAHRVALGWWILALAGFGLQIVRGGEAKRSRVQHVVFVLAGLGALALGGQLLRAEWFGGPALPPFAAARAQAEILAAFNRKDFNAAADLAERAVKVSPMAAPLYFQWGVLLLHFSGTDAEVDQVFHAQRLLNPTRPDVPLQQGDAWATADPRRTAMLWLDALDRRRHIESPGEGALPPEGGAAYYRGLLTRGYPYPEVQRELGKRATQSPAYALAWLDGAAPTLLPGPLAQMTANTEWLQGFSPKERQQFLLSWYGRGDRGELAGFLNAHPDWQAAGWLVHLRELTDAQRFEPAVRETAERYHVLLALPPPVPADEAVDPPELAEDAVTEFERYWQAGNTVSARRTLETAADTAGEHPRIAAEYWRLRTALAVQDGDWPKAWRYLKSHLQQVQPDEEFP